MTKTKFNTLIEFDSRKLTGRGKKSVPHNICLLGSSIDLLRFAIFKIYFLNEYNISLSTYFILSFDL